MGVYEHDRHPWITIELQRLARRLDRDLPTLGVCFGAQMMAAALGGEVYAGPVKELGFHPVRVHDNARDGPLQHLVDIPVLHWHGDTFTLPDGVELIASSHAYAHQAFRRGQNVLALQFHPEMGLNSGFDAWVEKWPEAIAETGLDATSLRQAYAKHGPITVAAGQAMITDWLSALG